MQKLYILAGPNGAGKSTFANEYLAAASQSLVFINADEIAKDLSALKLDKRLLDIKAAREMLTLIARLSEMRIEFMFETTLASLTYAHKIPIWKSLGYHIVLIYLRLSDADTAVTRVRRRVMAGGHDIPEATIRLRYAKSLDYLENLYKPLVDEWYIWDSLEGDFSLVQSWDDK